MLLSNAIPEQCKEELLSMGYRFDKLLGCGAWGKVVRASIVTPSSSNTESDSYCVSTSSSSSGTFFNSASTSSSSISCNTKEEDSCTEFEEESLAAIKIIDKTKLREKDWIKVEREAQSMAALQSHSSIIKLLQTLETDDFIYFVLEYCSQGDLLTLIQKATKKSNSDSDSKNTGLGEKEGKKFFKSLASAVQFAHSEGYIHRDIKLENLLITKDGSLRLADWGFSRRLEPGTLINHEFCGSVHYAAPELCLNTPYVGPEVDVWSLGVTLYSMVSGCLPFYGSQSVIVKNILSGTFPVLEDCFSESLLDLLKKMLTVRVEDRITLEEVLNHPWLISDEKPEPVTSSPSICTSSVSFVTASPFLRFGGSSGSIIKNPLLLISMVPSPISAMPALPSPVPVTSSPSPVEKHKNKAATKLQTFWRNLITRRLSKSVTVKKSHSPHFSITA